MVKNDVNDSVSKGSLVKPNVNDRVFRGSLELLCSYIEYLKVFKNPRKGEELKQKIIESKFITDSLYPRLWVSPEKIIINEYYLINLINLMSMYQDSI